MGQGQTDLLNDNVALAEAIVQAEWRGTKYIRPHQFVLRLHYPELYAALQERIRRDGYVRLFMSKAYRYVDISGWKYWIVGDVLNRTELTEKDLQGERR